MKIIEPQIIIDNENLTTVLILSNMELVEFYNKIPYIKAYEIQDHEGNISWLTFLSIFPNDFNFIYRKISDSLDIYQVIKKEIQGQITNNSEILLHLNQKT